MNSALNSSEFAAVEELLLGSNDSDLGTIKSNLGMAGTALKTVLSDMQQLVGAAQALQNASGSVSQPALDKLTTVAGSLPGELTNATNTGLVDLLQRVVSGLDGLKGLNPLPALKHAQLPDAVDVTLNWAPHLVDSFSFGPLQWWPGKAGDSSNPPPPPSGTDQFLSVSANIHAPLNGGDPSFSMQGVLGAFRAVVADSIQIDFNGITFSAKSGAKADVQVPTVDVTLLPPLSFMMALASIIPSDGMSDPPFVDISSDGIAVGFNFDLPSLTMGMFSLTNISLGAKVAMPWIGSTPVQIGFNFCTREHPFHLAVCFLGGGGFFGVGLGMDGLNMLEASLEFGADLSLNFVVASGDVSVMSGIYFKMQTNPESSALTGYVHIHGEVSVAGGHNLRVHRRRARPHLRHRQRRLVRRGRGDPHDLRARHLLQHLGGSSRPPQVRRLERSGILVPGEPHAMAAVPGRF